MRISLPWFSRSKSVPTKAQPKVRKPVKPQVQARWEPATMIEMSPSKEGEYSFKRDGGKMRVVPLRADTFERLDLKPLVKGQRYEIRVGTTHLGPEVAELRPLAK